MALYKKMCKTITISNKIKDLYAQRTRLNNQVQFENTMPTIANDLPQKV